MEKKNIKKSKESEPKNINEKKSETLIQAIQYITDFQENKVNLTRKYANENAYTFAFKIGILKCHAEQELKVTNLSRRLSGPFFREQTTLSLIDKLFNQTMGLLPSKEKTELLEKLNQLNQVKKEPAPNGR